MNRRRLQVHTLAWEKFDRLASGSGDADAVRTLRIADRSQRLLLLVALIDEIARRPELWGPLPTPDAAWELLVRVEQQAPQLLQRVLDHPYVGTWIGHTARLVAGHTATEHPLWLHTGYLHAIAAAAATSAGMEFETRIPLWHGQGMLPTLGMVRFQKQPSVPVADVYGSRDRVEIRTRSERVYLRRGQIVDTPNWWAMRHLVAEAGRLRFTVRLDDLDPYRSLTGPVPPRRLGGDETNTWQALFTDAWQLIVRLLPDLAQAIPSGLDSLSPRPAAPFSNLSASTGEAFGSAIIARTADAESLAATLVHEFQHIVLNGLMQLTPLHHDDLRHRYYTPWRDDPRPINGVLHGVYAFFGVTEFWRALAASGVERTTRRAAFEFARWRVGTWRVLQTVRNDPVLTKAGRRLVDRIAERLEPWQDEPLPTDIASLAATVAADHHGGWRIRHVRPNPGMVDRLATSWLAGRRWPAGGIPGDDQTLVPDPDGPWSSARAELIRLTLTERGRDLHTEPCRRVPGATPADYAFAAGRLDAAERGYRVDLATNPDLPVAWIGLGLALSAAGTRPAAARALLHRPELVRAVHRRIRHLSIEMVMPEELADWIGEHVH